MTPSARVVYSQLEKTERPCPVCGSADFAVLAREDRYRMGVTTSQCRGCALIMSNPALTPEAQDTFYRDHYRRFYRGTDHPDAEHLTFYGLRERAAYTASFLDCQGVFSDARTVLDVGCGEGSLLRAIHERHPSLVRVGIEPGTGFAAFAAQHAACLVLPSLDRVGDLGSPRAYDVIIANHVLEHVYDPVEFLTRLRALLTPQGCLYVDVPNAAAYASVQALHVAHVWHFTERTLTNVARTAQFEPGTIAPHRPPRHPASIRALLRPSTHATPALVPLSEPEVARRIGALARRAWLYHARQPLGRMSWRLKTLMASFRHGRSR